jgi:hypothetical protein
MPREYRLTPSERAKALDNRKGAYTFTLNRRAFVKIDQWARYLEVSRSEALRYLLGDQCPEPPTNRQGGGRPPRGEGCR